MAAVEVRTPAGATVGSLELDDALFGVTPHVPVLHQVITAQLAAARRGTQSTKTRAEVSGGGAKPFRQKGTGRARQGSTRAPHWSGGGVALGPKPRSYRQRTPKKMIRLALASALSDRAAQARVIVVDAWAFGAPSTKEASAALSALGVDGRVLVVVSPDDEATIKSFRNLPEVALLLRSELNAYDVLCSDWIVFSRSVVPGASGDMASADMASADVASADMASADLAGEDAADRESSASAVTGDEVNTAEPAEGIDSAAERTGAEEGEA